MVYRIYVERKPGMSDEAESLKEKASVLLGNGNLKGVRVINRYDADDIDEALFEECRWKVFANPRTDFTAASLEELPFENYDPADAISRAATVFASEPLSDLPDSRADAAEQCIQMISRGKRPVVKCARVWVLYGELSGNEIAAIKNFMINPLEERETSLDLPESLTVKEKAPSKPRVLEEFTRMNSGNFADCIARLGLEMDASDLNMCLEYFRDTEKRDPNVKELELIDALWADRRRQTALNTVINSVTVEEVVLEKAYKDYLALRKDLGQDRPVTLMDIATIANRKLRREGKLDKIDENGALMISVDAGGEKEPWLLTVKSRTENLPEDKDPYGGASACLSGCVRDAVSGRAYAYAAMRLSGAADSGRPLSEALPGTLPRSRAAVRAAEGFSSFSNQMGISTGIADEIYYPGYTGGRMETAAVVAAAPSVNVRKERPAAGDAVMLLAAAAGHKTVSGTVGDGSEETNGRCAAGPCGALGERSVQRLFRNDVATRIIKKCAAIGRGGVGAAAATLADGLDVNLDAVPKDCGGIAACVIDAENERLFKTLAAEENLLCEKIASVTDKERLVIHGSVGRTVDISTEFLNTNGEGRHVDIVSEAPRDWKNAGVYEKAESFTEAMNTLACDLNVCSKKNLAEIFDSTAGAGTVLMPFGGRRQLTPVQAMTHKIPLEHGNTDDCSLMAWGYNPYIEAASPYHGAYLAVVESVAKLIASGA